MNNLRYHLLFTALLGFTAAAVAQSVDQWTMWGDAAAARGEYYGASRFYAGALALEPGRMALQWKQAEACRSSNQYDKAAEFYDRVQRKDMGRMHPEALRWLGEMQMSMGEYSDAERTWNKVLQREKDKTSVVAQRAANAIAGCALARSLGEGTATPAIEHMPMPLNSFDTEFGARYGPDSLLYFTTLRGELSDDGEVKDTANYHTALARIRIPNIDGAIPEQLGATINGQGDNANAAWSLDGKWLFFTRCVAGYPCRIHVAPVTAQGIGEARVLAGIGDDAVSTQPMIVHWEGMERLLFVTDRPGGEGGMDIWKAELHGGSAQFLSPLGKPVNTPGNERCPWFDNASNTLWYSSDHLPGLGGYDIFTTVFGDDVFAQPVNAGSPINSPANDLYPAIYPAKGESWITSNRKGSFAAKGETCCNDLYRWTTEKTIAGVHEPIVDPIAIRTTHELRGIQRKFPVKLYFHNDEPEPRSWATTTAQDYGRLYRSYKALVPAYLKEQDDPQAIEAFFDVDVDRGWGVLHELTVALLMELEQGNSLTLDVRGHASPLARPDYNRNLSSRRIESLRNYMRLSNNAMLAPYLDGTAVNGARLSVRELPYGEDRSASGVSDDLRDLKRSVYSVGAARERRIEVIAVEWEGQDQVGSETLLKLLGNLEQGVERHVRFTINNDGSVPLTLLDSKADCGCTTAELPEGPIPPGKAVDVVVTFNGRAPDGPLRRTVTIHTDGTPAVIELVIEGMVVP